MAMLKSFDEVAATVGHPPWELPATLSLPHEGSSGIALVLLHGSGPNDRDGTVGSLRPLRDLAHGLARRGFAVLRYEKRTWRYRRECASAEHFTVDDEVVDDALRALALVRSDLQLRAHRTYLVGHSFGAMLAPRIAARDGNVAGLVLMASPGRTVPVLWREQLEYLAGHTPLLTAGRAARLAKEAAVASDRGQLSALPPNSLVLGLPPSYWLDLLDYDPLSVSRELALPMLVVHALRDYHVREPDRRAWRFALRHRKHVSFRTYRSLNHMFVAGAGPSLPSEYNVIGRMATRVIEDVAGWIAGSTSRPS
jgi:uncharacterized protein